MTVPAPGTSRRVHVPAERLYWAVLDCPGSADQPDTTRRLVAAGSPVLDIMLAPWIPLPIDHVCTAFAPLADGRVLACALPVADLSQFIADGAIELFPAGLPRGAHTLGDVDLSGMNLLRGQWEPPSLRAARRRINATLTVAAVVACLLTWIGFERRVSIAHRQSALTAEAHRTMLRPLGASAAPAAIAAQIASLERTTTGEHSAAGRTLDASEQLALLLASWPEQGSLRVESLSVQPTTLTVSAALPSDADASVVLAPLRAVPGWTLLQPQASAGQGASRLSLRWLGVAPAPTASAGGGP